jgi:hypothetical protein
MGCLRWLRERGWVEHVRPTTMNWPKLAPAIVRYWNWTHEGYLRNCGLEEGRVGDGKKPSAGWHSLSHAIAEWVKLRRAI